MLVIAAIALWRRDGASPLVVLAAYFPQLQAKAPFFAACMTIAANHTDVPLLLIGDLNTGCNESDIEGDDLHGWRHVQLLVVIDLCQWPALWPPST